MKTVRTSTLTFVIGLCTALLLLAFLSACGESSQYNPGDSSNQYNPPRNSSNQYNPSGNSSAGSPQAQGFTINVDSIQIQNAQGTDAYGNSYSEAQILRFLQDDVVGVRYYLPQGTLSNLHYHNAYSDLYCSVDLTNNMITVSSYSYAIRQGVVSNGVGGNGGTSGFTVSFTASIQTF